MIEETHYESDSSISLQYSYKYNKKGIITEGYGYSVYKTTVTKYKFEYDNRGNQTGKVEYSPKGNIYYSSKMKYDKQNNLIESIWYNGDGSIWERTLHKYDIYGNKIKTENYNKENELESAWDYAYFSSATYFTVTSMCPLIFCMAFSKADSRVFPASL